jgi:hypothetical protein
MEIATKQIRTVTPELQGGPIWFIFKCILDFLWLLGVSRNEVIGELYIQSHIHLNPAHSAPMVDAP